MSDWKIGLFIAFSPILIPLFVAPGMTIEFIVKLWRTYQGKKD